MFAGRIFSLVSIAIAGDETSQSPSTLLSSGLIVAGWVYFLHFGAIDKDGGATVPRPW